MTHLELELSALLDGELTGDALVAAESHLLECAECRATLESLRALKRRAGALDDRPPARDLWAGIQRRIADAPVVAITSAPSRRRRFSFTVPQLAAAAVALMLLSAGAAALLLVGPAPVPAGYAVLDVRSGPAMAAPVSLEKAPGGVGIASYDAAIREMELALRDRRTVLDTATVRVVQQSLFVIDAAVRQAREALARDPNNLYLNDHLQNALGRKLDLLRQVATLPTVS